jgi:small subunit ribosomal protein S21
MALRCPWLKIKNGKRGDSFVEIQVIDNNVEKAIRVLKRKLQQEGLFREMKQRKYYEKPSVKRKRKEKEAQRRLRKKMRLMRTD